MKNICIALLLLSFLGCSDNIDFNSQNWKSDTLKNQTYKVRKTMAVSLIKSDTLKGLKLNQIKELLGQPDSIISRKRIEGFIYEIDKENRKHLIIDLDYKSSVISYRLGKPIR